MALLLARKLQPSTHFFAHQSPARCKINPEVLGVIALLEMKPFGTQTFGNGSLHSEGIRKNFGLGLRDRKAKPVLQSRCNDGHCVHHEFAQPVREVDDLNRNSVHNNSKSDAAPKPNNAVQRPEKHTHL